MQSLLAENEKEDFEMLTIEEIRKEIDTRDDIELECISREKFLNPRFEGNGKVNKMILDQEKLIVSGIEHGDILLKGSIGGIARNAINESEIKYFRIKHPAPTFYDLVRVAVQAHEDGVIKRLTIGVRGIIFEAGINLYSFTNIEAEEVINLINSLYTETFVIEGVDDIRKVNIKDGNAKITLVNGIELRLDGSQDSSNQDGFAVGVLLPNGRTNYYGITVLKGATVTQERGAA